MLQIAPLVGPGLSVTSTTCDVLISEALWRRRFGSRRDAIGRSLVIEGESCAVAGVMPRASTFLALRQLDLDSGPSATRSGAARSSQHRRAASIPA